jgi:predicted lipid-binding transport protein (Tim44 family)
MALVVAACLGGGQALGDDMYIYPSKGQSPEQQSRDRYECHRWAVQQTGVDPTSAQAAQAPPPPPPKGGVFKGATRGAAVGAIGGAIGGDAGKGAAIGAATGGVIGGMRQRQQANSQQQAQANQAAQQQSALVAYNRAVSACLSGRGYTVK